MGPYVSQQRQNDFGAETALEVSSWLELLGVES
jgi:hypothetical protein